MLTQKDQKTIRSRLDKIYKTFLSKKDIDYSEKEIFQIIRLFNKKNPKKKINRSHSRRRTSEEENEREIKVFKFFF